MLDLLKKKLPGLYDFYCRVQRLKVLKKAERMEALPTAEYPKRIEAEYQKALGHRLDWDHLQTYTEKMQWEKLYDKNPLKAVLADKYRVREWVENRIGKEYLIPLLGVWDSFDDIDFNGLPAQFVLKTNHGSGTNLIVKDKEKLNIKRTKRMFDDWMKMNYAFTNGLELHYKDIPRKIIAEEYIKTEQGELHDYKFLCFDGKPCFCWVDLDRYTKHTRKVFNIQWEAQPWTQAHFEIADYDIPKPQNYDQMVEIAAALSEGFSHVRVDLYNVSGKIYFGEMTFTNESEFSPIIPEEYDEVLGKYWNLPIDREGET